MKLLLADLHKFVGYSGGIEHVLSRMAKAFSEKGYTVSVVMADEREGEPFYAMPESVHFYNLFRMPGKKPIRTGMWSKLLREAARAFSKEKARDRNYAILAKGRDGMKEILEKEQPDVIVSFREPTGRLLLEGVGMSVPVISMLHNDPDEIFAHSPEGEKKALLKSRAIQVLMPSFVGKAKKYLDYNAFAVIPNGIYIPPAEVDLSREKDRYTITNVGRVTGRTKRQHLLVEAFSLLAEDFPEWDVEIWGDTYDKAYVAALKALISKKGLQDRVFLKGTTKDMASVWAHTDIFAFPSHHEGFPLALTEAMGEGIPAVGYRSCPSVNELIEDNRNGYLTEDGAEAFARALRKLMEDRKERIRLGNGARESMEQYLPEKVWEKWEVLLNQTVENG